MMDTTTEAEMHDTPTGMVFDIQKFSTYDGPGIRTTVFLKGCPLRCLWCHNPESISPEPQLAYYAHKCSNCGECVTTCPVQAHTIENGQHVYSCSKCIACGKCEEACLGNSLRLYGKTITVDEAYQLVMEDLDFYDPDGGVTLSGGEPLLQPEFCYELLYRLKQAGVHTAIDTCGHVRREAFERVLPVTDLFLYDFKHSDSAEHRQWTGQRNELIQENLKFLSESRANLEIRLPLIPGCNDSETNLRNTGLLLKKLNITKVKIIPYHSLAKSKYAALDIEYRMHKTNEPAKCRLASAISVLQEGDVRFIL